MQSSRRNKLIGFLYLTPALLFVLVFTAYPFLQMSVGLTQQLVPHHASELRRTRQLRAGVCRPAVLGVARLHPQVHAADHADPDHRWLSDRALGLGQLAASPVHRTIVFIPVVIGLGVSSLLWYWLFSADFGFVNQILLDLGLISKPIIWLGRCGPLELRDHHVGRLEGHRLRDDPLRRRDPGHPDRDHRSRHGRRRQFPATGRPGDPPADPALGCPCTRRPGRWWSATWQPDRRAGRSRPRGAIRRSRRTARRRRKRPWRRPRRSSVRRTRGPSRGSRLGGEWAEHLPRLMVLGVDRDRGVGDLGAPTSNRPKPKRSSPGSKVPPDWLATISSVEPTSETRSSRLPEGFGNSPAAGAETGSSPVASGSSSPPQAPSSVALAAMARAAGRMRAARWSGRITTGHRREGG